MDIRSAAARQLGAVLTAALMSGAAGVASAQFSISRFTVDGGGGVPATGGAFTAVGTVGQPDAGLLAAGNFVLSGGFWLAGDVAASVEDVGPHDGIDLPTEVPLSFKIYPARPNPVATQMVIAFDLPEPTSVRASVYDTAGRLVRLLADESVPAGRHQRVWDRRDSGGNLVPSGIYFVLFDAGEHRSRQRVVIVY